MNLTVEKSDETGYFLVLEDGVVIAKSKSSKQAKRIVLAFEALKEVARCYHQDWGSYDDPCSCFMEKVTAALEGQGG